MKQIRQKPYPIDMFFPYYNGRRIQEEIKKIFPEDGSNQWIGQGDLVDKFEDEFKRKFNLPYCLFVNSGSAALQLAYHLIGIKKGDEVITPVLTCTATQMSLLHMGAKLIFADIKPSDLTISPLDVEHKITKKTKAIIAVTLGGIPIDKKIFKIGKKHHIPVIVDSCQSPGYNKGDYMAYSFQAIKHMTTCDGGMLVVRKHEEYKRAKLLRWFGIDREQKAKKGWQAWNRRAMTFDIIEPGFKFQPTNLDAMLGLIALEDWDKILKERKEFVEIYKRELKSVKGIEFLNDKGSTHWLFGILTERRDELATRLGRMGIGTNLVHLRNDLFAVFKKFKTPCPGMDSVQYRYLYLPLHNKLTKKDIFAICLAIKTIKHS